MRKALKKRLSGTKFVQEESSSDNPDQQLSIEKLVLELSATGTPKLKSLNRLFKLGLEAESKRNIVKCPGLLEALVGILTSEREDKATKLQALKCLTQLGLDMKNQGDMFVFPGLVSALLGLIAQPNVPPDLQRDAIIPLAQLAMKNSNWRPMFLFPELVSILLNAVASQESKLETLKILIMLSVEETNRMEMLNFPHLLSWLLDCQHDKTANFLKSLKVLYNFSNTGVVREAMRKNDQIVNLLVATRSQNTHENVLYFASSTLVNLVGAEEDTSLLGADSPMLERIVQALRRRLQGERGWSLENPLRQLRYLSVVDANRELLRKIPDLLQSLSDAAGVAIQEEDQQSVEFAFSCLSQFAFDEASLVWMRSEDVKPALLALVGKVKDTWPPAQRAALAFQFQVVPFTPSHTVVDPLAQTNRIMISYQWQTQPLARKLDAVLTRMGFSVWRDEKAMHGNIIDAMAEGVQSSDVVFLLVSRSYKESSNCKIECNLAFNCQKKIVPLLVQHDYVNFKSDGWLGAILGSLLYYPLSDEDESNLESTMVHIVKRELGKVSLPATTTPSATITTSRQIPNSEAEISAWLADFPSGSVLATVLSQEEIRNAEDLRLLRFDEQMQSQLGLKGLTTKQVFTLKAALRQLFG